MKTIMKISIILLFCVFVLGCADNQDDKWHESTKKNSLMIGSDLRELGADFEKADAARCIMSSKYLYDDCEYALRESQKYTVSPSMEEPKREYELALKDYMEMAEISHESAQRWKAGDVSNAVAELNQITTYLESGNNHLSAANLLL